MSQTHSRFTYYLFYTYAVIRYCILLECILKLEPKTEVFNNFREIAIKQRA